MWGRQTADKKRYSPCIKQDFTGQYTFLGSSESKRVAIV